MNPLAGKRPLGPIAGTSCALVAVALAGPFLREVFMGVGAQPVAQLMPSGAQDLGDLGRPPLIRSSRSFGPGP